MSFRALFPILATVLPAFVGCDRATPPDDLDLKAVSVTLSLHENKAVADIADHTRAQLVILHECDLKTMLQVLNSTPDVRRLYLGGKSVDDSVLEKVATIPRLQSLSLYDTSITDKGFVHLTKCQDIYNLEVLIAPRIGKSIRSVVSRLRSLEVLVLSLTSADDNSVPKGVALVALRELYLDGERITDDALARLDAPNLRKLELLRTRVSDAGLSNLERFPLLEELSLDASQNITGDCLVFLAEHPMLSKVNLAATRVTDEQAMKLRWINPDLDIVLHTLD